MTLLNSFYGCFSTENEAVSQYSKFIQNIQTTPYTTVAQTDYEIHSKFSNSTYVKLSPNKH